MYTHDVRRLLQWAHQRFEETNLPQWSHSEKWKKYCEVCQAREEISHEYGNMDLLVLCVVPMIFRI